MSSQYRRWRAIHRWCGAIAGIYVLCIAATGVILQFKQDIMAWSYPALRAPVVLAPAEIEAAVIRLEAHFAPVGITHVQLPGPATGYFHLWLNDGTEATASADDLTILEHGNAGRSLLAVIESLHTHLLLDSGGKYLVGIGGIIVLLVLVAAAFTWMPFARRTRLDDLRPRKPSRARLIAFHRTSGCAFWIPAIVLSLTGVALAFGDTSSAFLRTVFGGEPYPERPELAACPELPAPLSGQIAAASRQFPAARLTFLIRPDQCRSAPGFRFEQHGEWHPDGASFVYLDPQSLRPLTTFSATSLGLGTDLSKRIFPLHAGTVASFVLTPVLAICGTVLAVLAATGVVTFLQWLHRRRRPPRSSASL